MKVKMIATELVDAEVDYISLVRHGANRTPFKIVKADEPERAKTLAEVIEDFRALVEPTLNKQQAPKAEPVAREEKEELKMIEVTKRDAEIAALRSQLERLNMQWERAIERANDPVSRKLLGHLEDRLVKTESELYTLVDEREQLAAGSAFFYRGGSSVHSAATLSDSAYERPVSKEEQTISLETPLTQTSKADEDDIDLGRFEL